MTEIVPLPEEKVEARSPINIQVEPDVTPGNRFTIRLDWNSRMEQFILRIIHESSGTKVAHGPAKLLWEYDFKNLVSFILYDPTLKARKVTPNNLGRNVRIGIFPLERAETE